MLARLQRMQLLSGIEPECEAEVAAVPESLGNRLRPVVLEDAEVLPKHFGKRPVGGAVPVREAAAGSLQRLRVLVGEPAPQLAHEARLADARVADDRHELGCAAGRDARVGGAELFELALAPDERTAQPADAARAHQGERPGEPAATDAAGLAFCLDRGRFVELEGTAHRGGRTLADEGFAGRRRLLEARTHVDGVAGDEPASLPRAADDDLPCVDADPQCELVAEELAKPPVHRERGVQRTLRVILERRRRAEGRHHRVANELLNRPAGRFDLSCHRVVEAVEDDPRPLRVLRPGECG